ncbi:MAG TPA: acetyl-CoA carboxylase biotin carboxylase subunit [Chloroflexota bacterium]|nr:acetyl-CoA carboxylase biotin carboxylase subunit [Chloroflexota bacterium]
MLTTFRKVLVANRGEIAIRILRACSELGLRTVAVYSEADRNALHVRYADEAYCIGPASARESYLSIDKIIEVARQSRAEAIHPGYGFLSEKEEFAQACVDNDIVFIGPRPESIAAMGDKIAARRTVKAAGVPVVPGSDGPVASVDEARAIAEQIGFPVLLKATAGGGGKGMRTVKTPDELAMAFRMASSEAQSAFGDGTLYVERLLEGVRHVEIQVLADRHGNTVHLGERECSIQRRRQKLIEEAPSPVVDEELRQRMGEVAVKAAQAVGYENAGTVEFLLDRERNFYFLEMNTRLQVEHPITEMVTGVDLVVEQIRVAMGRRLRLRQKDIALKGHAIECRVCAEDPYNDYLPSIGKITTVNEPSGPGVRVDSAVYSGYEVSLYYDPMVAKLIVRGENRAQAIQRMRRALSEFKLLGIRTNIPFHLRMMESPTYIAGRFDNSFLETFTLASDDETGERAKLAAIAATAVAHQLKQAQSRQSAGERQVAESPWKSAGRRSAVGL